MIGPLAEEQLIDFLPGGRQRKALEYMNGYFLDAGLNTKIVIEKMKAQEELSFSSFRIRYSVQ